MWSIPFQEKGIKEAEQIKWAVWKEGRKEANFVKEEMAKHHQLNGHDFEQTPGDSGGQGSMARCSPRGRKESNTTQ